MESSCWSKAIEIIGEYCHRDSQEPDQEDLAVKKQIVNNMVESSVLFQIELRPVLNLLADNPEVGDDNNSGNIAFPDIFSAKRQFMIVSKREDTMASWKQFLVPLLQDGEGIVNLLKKYSIMDNRFSNKDEVGKQILKAGENALRMAKGYGVNTLGESNDVLPGEYRQQYFLKWLLKNIPTIAMFMSDDGNIRVNILHSQILPSLFMNDAAKILILKRIMEEVKLYGIQRFSIPSWQGLEYLKCRHLPYSFYFIKRGYLSKESYGKVIFPFEEKDLTEIAELFDPSGNIETMQSLIELCSVLNIRKYIMDNLAGLEERLDSWIEEYYSPSSANEETGDKREGVKADFLKFTNDMKSNRKDAYRIVDRVRVEYRELIIDYITSNERRNDDKIFEIEERKKYIDQWRDVYILILLWEISGDIVLDQFIKIKGRINDAMDSLSSAWLYIIDKKYLDDLEILKYKERYRKELEDGGGAVSGKHEKIVRYIERYSNSGLQGEHLMQYWRRYIGEIFLLFAKIEEECYQSMEGMLPDKLEIERQLYAQEDK